MHQPGGVGLGGITLSYLMVKDGYTLDWPQVNHRTISNNDRAKCGTEENSHCKNMSWHTVSCGSMHFYVWLASFCRRQAELQLSHTSILKSPALHYSCRTQTSPGILSVILLTVTQTAGLTPADLSVVTTEYIEMWNTYNQLWRGWSVFAWTYYSPHTGNEEKKRGGIPFHTPQDVSRPRRFRWKMIYVSTVDSERQKIKIK